MPQRTKHDFFQEVSLSQKLAHRHPEYSEYAGADPTISTALANLNVFAKFGLIDSENPGFKLLKALLNEQRKAIFATSEKVNEITKMGLQMPKAEDVYIGDADE